MFEIVGSIGVTLSIEKSYTEAEILSYYQEMLENCHHAKINLEEELITIE